MESAGAKSTIHGCSPAESRLAHLEALIDHAAEGLVLLDVESFTYIHANETAASLLGVEREALIEQGPAALARASAFTLEAIRASCSEAVQRFPQSFTEIRKYTRTDGAQGWLEVRHRALQAAGKWAVAGALRDVTERVRGRARQQYLQAAMNQADDAIAVIDPETLAYLDVNEGAARLTGRPREVLMEQGPLGLRQALGIGGGEALLRSRYEAAILRHPEAETELIESTAPDGRPIVLEVSRRAVSIEGKWLILAVNRDVTQRHAAMHHLELLKAAIDEAADAVMVIDPQRLTLVDVNRAGCALYSMGREELLARPLMEIRNGFGLATSDELNELYREVIAAHPQPVTAVRPFHREGLPGVMVESKRRALQVDGRWLIVSVMRDVTERIESQQRLQQLQAAINQATDAISVIDPESLAYVHVNEAAARALGISREELMRRGPAQLGMGLSATVEQLRERYAKLIAIHPESTVETLHARPADGRPLVVEASRRAVQIDGRWLVLTMHRDITERHYAMQRLERLLAAMNETADAIVVIDPQAMSYEDVNEGAARLLGTTREAMIAMGPAALSRMSSGASPEHVQLRLQQAIDRYPDSIQGVHEFSRADGAVRVAEFRRRAVHVDGRWLVVQVAHDVTQRVAEQRRMQQLQAAINEASDAIFVIDLETMGYIDANEAAARFAGCSREELMRRGPLSVTQGMGLATTQASLRARAEALKARYPDELTETFQARNASGEWVMLEATQRAVRIDGTWLVLAMHRDITERHAASRRQQRLRAALNEAAEVIVVIDAKTGEYVDANEAAARVVGLSREELMKGGPLVYRQRMGMSSDAGEALRNYEDLIRRYPASVTDTYRGTPPGRPPVVIEATRRAVQIDGQWLILAVHRDITERHAAMQRLELLHAAIDQTADVIMVIDPATLTYVYVNRAIERVHGIPVEKMMEHGVMWARQQLEAGPATEDELRQRYDELIAAYPRPITILFNIRRRNGTAATLEVTRRAIRIEGRWLILNVSHDVTERVRAEQELNLHLEELARSNRDLEQFAYVASHDLSEPLRMVTSYIQLLERRYGPTLEPDAREFMGFIVGGAQRMKRLIDDLLLYSRAGRAGSQMRELQLDRALDEALANLDHVIREAGVTIERPEPLPQLACNKTGMTQLFQNLVGNAVKFRSGPAPVVRISAAREGEDWIVSVTDNGIGIEPQYFGRIFEIFQRLHARNTYEGTGIGLAICKKIVERHGGDIWVDSQPGQGTSFRFRLPAVAPASPVAAPRALPSPQRSQI
ncbi:PAS domain S-box protein [Caenimonas aquaedulcis]|uniref:histidine kinase n=1 Tax=Caenimonas aquaedulcis TaxID=2793270 RepID=A0A931MI31_9BURK|nr:PAS domain S-box protein [Caenimonas aquaedulcis]MBG9388805.1 PAS domain S-box protein [Caenimonas aquaedulcis]